MVVDVSTSAKGDGEDSLRPYRTFQCHSTVPLLVGWPTAESECVHICTKK